MGVRSLEVRTEHVDAHFPSIGTMMEVDLLGWLPRCGFAARSIVLADDVVTEILDEAERVFAPFVAPDGSVVFDLSAHIVSGTSG